MVILGVDFGSARTGLAVCDPNEILASPLKQIECRGKSLTNIATTINEYAKQRGATEFVVGYPKNMDGTDNDMSVKCKTFADKLAQISGLSVILRDERLTTVMSHDILSSNDVYGKKRKAVTDAAAAVIILQEYLDYRRNNTNLR